jgi:hypothetical protein
VSDIQQLLPRNRVKEGFGLGTEVRGFLSVSLDASSPRLHCRHSPENAAMMKRAA